jgi:hypothetical protein
MEAVEVGAGTPMPGSLALATRVQDLPASGLFVAPQASLTGSSVIFPDLTALYEVSADSLAVTYASTKQASLTGSSVIFPDLTALYEVSADSLAVTYASTKSALEFLKESGNTATIALDAPWSANIVNPNTYSFSLAHECAHFSLDAEIDIAPGLQPANYWWVQPKCNSSARCIPISEIQCNFLTPLWHAYRGENPDALDVELQEIIKADSERPVRTYIWVLLSNDRAVAAAELTRKVCLSLLVLNRVTVRAALARARNRPASAAAIIRTFMSHRHRHEPADGRLLPQIIHPTHWRAAIVR